MKAGGGDDTETHHAKTEALRNPLLRRNEKHTQTRSETETRVRSADLN